MLGVAWDGMLVAFARSGSGYGHSLVRALRSTCLSALVGRNNKSGPWGVVGTLGAWVPVGVVGTLVAVWACGAGCLIMLAWKILAAC